MTEILKSDNFNSLFKNYIGTKVMSCHLIQYVTPEGNAESDDVELELIFEKDIVLRLATASNGEQVSVSYEPWVDAFKEPISDENQEFIKEHGKWCIFDVSNQPPFSSMLGKSIETFEGLQDQFGILAGVAITCGDKVMCFCANCDEGKLFWGKNNLNMIALGFRPFKRN